MSEHPQEFLTPPHIEGDESAKLIAALHTAAIGKGYEKVRLDRGKHPITGDWYELGYSYGAVGARFSHRRNGVLRRTEGAETLFAAWLVENARSAAEKIVGYPRNGVTP